MNFENYEIGIKNLRKSQHKRGNSNRVITFLLTAMNDGEVSKEQFEFLLNKAAEFDEVTARATIPRILSEGVTA